MKKLIICEKPSLAKTVTNAIRQIGEKFTYNKDKGFSESEQYIIVPAFGHLFKLADIEEYQPNYDKSKKYSWTFDNLPCLPKHKFVLPNDMGIKNQYKTIKSLIDRNDVECIINCGDSDREGEIIIRIILEQAKNHKPVFRLWLPNQAETTIINAINNLEDDKKYDNLANEGYARMFIDWNYGVNLTRYASLKSGTLLNVGRVISAIVKTIYDRDIEIKNFKPEKYFEIISKEATNGKLISLTYKDKFNLNEKEKAIEIANKLNSEQAIVTNISNEKKIIPSPKLFSQSSLQNILSKKYGYSPDKTLSLVQSLYEKGYLSYPRTETEYLSVNEKDNVKKIISAIVDKFNSNLEFKDTKRIFDDSKIKSHSAITPTTKLPDLNSLSDEEQNCYKIVLNKFIAAFYNEEYIISQQTIDIKIGDENFKVVGKTPVQLGWKAIENTENIEDEDKEILLPNLNIDDNININFQISEKETKPKKLYTVETLNNYLKNPFKEEIKNESDDDDYKAFLNGLEIGTEATRADIIKRAIKMEYISLNKTTYSILPKGEFLVKSLDKLNIDMSKGKTVYLNKLITDVYKNEITVEQAVSEVDKEILNIFNKNIELDKSDFNTSSIIGICPKCGKNIIEYSKSFSCESGKNGCGFVVWREIAQKKITTTQVKKLLSKKKTDLIKGFTSKSGKNFNAYLTLKDDFTIGFEFEK